MPPRKRAAAQPKETPTLEDPQAPVDSTEEPGADNAPQVEPTDSANPDDTTDATPTPSGDSDDTEPSEQPCTQCWPAGWPEGATSLGCGHGSWNRDL
jgi:hypothetical protein